MKMGRNFNLIINNGYGMDELNNAFKGGQQQK